MQGVRAFADTNIVFYSRDTAGDPRVEISRRWFAALAQAEALVINLQVLNELTQVLFRKRTELSQAEVFAAIDELIPFGSESLTLDTLMAARGIRMATNYSWWDCLLLASALELRCSHFLSEDLKDGQRIGAMTILNPFTHHPGELLGPSES